MTFQSIRPVRVYGFGAIEPVARNFIRFKSAAQQHIALSDPVVLSGDFEFSCDFTRESGVAAGAVIGDTGGNFIRISSSDAYQYMIDGSYYSTGVLAPTDGRLHNFRLVRTGSTAKIYADGAEVDSRTVTTDDFTISDIGSRITHTFYAGILANMQAWTGGDRDTGTLVNEWPLGDSLEDGIIRSTTAVEGPEIVINGDFDGISDWLSMRGASLSTDSGQLVVTNGVAGFGGAVQPITLEVGQQYIVSADYEHVDGSGFLMISGSSNLGNPRMLEVEVAVEDTKFIQVFTATHESAYVGVAQGSTATPGTVAKFGDITIKKLIGGTYGTAVNMDSSDSELFEYDSDNSYWLGPDLITQDAWENPAIAGVQWSFSSDKWTLNGDGGLSVLSILLSGDQPENMRVSGFVESITGVGLSASSASLPKTLLDSVGGYSFDMTKTEASSQLYKRASGPVTATITKPSLREILEVAS